MKYCKKVRVIPEEQYQRMIKNSPQTSNVYGGPTISVEDILKNIPKNIKRKVSSVLDILTQEDRDISWNRNFEVILGR